MGSWLFAWLQAKALMIVLVAVLSGGGIYLGIIKYENFDLKRENRLLTSQIRACNLERAQLKTQSKYFSESLDLLEKQCKELLRYEKNKPKKPQSDDTDVDDVYLDNLFRRMRNNQSPDTVSPDSIAPSKSDSPGETGKP